MSDTQQAKSDSARAKKAELPKIKISTPKPTVDLATILGLGGAIGLIIAAITMGESNASFFNVPALMIVLLGTMAATATSFTVDEVGRAGQVIGKSLFRKAYNPSELARTLLDLASLAKKKGFLAISQYADELEKDPYLDHAMQMATDGYNAQDIDFILTQDIDSLVERHKRSANITLRASEVAPAMGLIGTLVGLVQMLADLENPETIGPAMAVALLTTFYGAILGTIVMAPLSVKLDKNSRDEKMIRTMIKITAISIAKLENPRRLEKALNAELPPSERVRYFD